MGAWLRLFLTPYGRIGRRSFWHGWLVLTAVNLGLFSLAAVMSKGGLNPWLWLSPMATLYSTVCLYAKRLADIGRPGWLQTPARLGLTIFLAFFAVTNGKNQGLYIDAVVAISGVTGVIMDPWLLFLAGATRGPRESGLDLFD